MFLNNKEYAIGFLLVLATRLYMLISVALGRLFNGTYVFIEILTLLYCLIFAYMSIEEKKESKKDE